MAYSTVTVVFEPGHTCGSKYDAPSVSTQSSDSSVAVTTYVSSWVNAVKFLLSGAVNTSVCSPTVFASSPLLQSNGWPSSVAVTPSEGTNALSVGSSPFAAKRERLNLGASSQTLLFSMMKVAFFTPLPPPTQCLCSGSANEKESSYSPASVAPAKGVITQPSRRTTGERTVPS